MADLRSYVRHAERYGCEDVFETAAGDLSLADLGRLSLRLQNIDPKWKVPHAGTFAVRLLADGVADRDVCRMAKVSRSTLWRLKQTDRENPAPQGAFQSGESVSNPATLTDGADRLFGPSEGVYGEAA